MVERETVCGCVLPVYTGRGNVYEGGRGCTVCLISRVYVLEQRAASCFSVLELGKLKVCTGTREVFRIL